MTIEEKRRFLCDCKSKEGWNSEALTIIKIYIYAATELSIERLYDFYKERNIDNSISLVE